MEYGLQLSKTALARRCELVQTSLADMDELLSLKLDVRNLVLDRLDALREILLSKSPNKACMEIAYRKEREGAKGWSYKRLDALYSEFSKSGDWRVLPPNWRGAKAGLPKAFVEYFREQLLSGSRKTPCRAARRQLINAFRRGDSIPGYGTKYEWAASTGRPVPGMMGDDRELPEGWSLGNLQKIKPRNKYILEGARQGVFAAHSSAPAMLLRDRSKLRFMEVIAFDDVRIDKICTIAEKGMKRQFGYPLAVFALDVATGCDIAHIVKPRAKRKEDDSVIGIASEDVKQLILNIISQRGLPPYPVKFLIENAAATLSEADELALKQTFRERIIIERCGVLRDTFLQNGFYERGGKPWFKAWIEAFFRPFQEQLALTDGSSGNRYDNMPAQTKYAAAYAKNLLKKCGARDDVFEKLIMPYPRFEEICDTIIEALDALRKRTDHRLQGFDTITEWRRDKFDRVHSQAEMAQLSDDELARIEVWDRLESPLERMERLARDIDFWRPDPRLYAHLYQLKQVWKFEIKNGGCTFAAKSLKIHKCERIQENLVFRAPSDDVIENYTGKEMLVYFSDDLSIAHLTYNNTYVCAVERVRRVDLRDENAIKCAAGIVHRRSLEGRAVLTELMPRTEERLANMRAHNDRVLREAGLLSENMRKSENARMESSLKRNSMSQDAAFDTLAGLTDESQDGYEFDPVAALEDFTENEG